MVLFLMALGTSCSSLDMQSCINMHIYHHHTHNTVIHVSVSHPTLSWKEGWKDCECCCLYMTWWLHTRTLKVGGYFCKTYARTSHSKFSHNRDRDSQGFLYPKLAFGLSSYWQLMGSGRKVETGRLPMPLWMTSHPCTYEQH